MPDMIDKKQINNKFKRAIKYWRVRYQQTTERERLNLTLFAFLAVTYVWWMLMVMQ